MSLLRVATSPVGRVKAVLASSRAALKSRKPFSAPPMSAVTASVGDSLRASAMACTTAGSFTATIIFTLAALFR